MNPTDTDERAILASVGSDFENLCRSIGEDQWSLPTPCTEWDLEDLVDHVTGGNRFTVLVLGGATAEDAMAETRKSFDESHEPRTAALSSIKAQRLAFDDPDVLDRTCNHIAGELTGREVLRIRLHELIIHTWDIAEAVNPPASIRDGYVEWSHAEIANPDSNTTVLFALDTSALGGERSEAALLTAFGRGSSR